jgi:hypothetical protein
MGTEIHSPLAATSSISTFMTAVRASIDGRATALVVLQNKAAHIRKTTNTRLVLYYGRQATLLSHLQRAAEA